ncbi:unnamed protein product [Sphagnum tenellum]
MQDSGQVADLPAGTILEEAPIEKISQFESLENYAAANPTPEPPLSSVSDSDFQTTQDENNSPSSSSSFLPDLSANPEESLSQDFTADSSDFSSPSQSPTQDSSLADTLGTPPLTPLQANDPSTLASGPLPQTPPLQSTTPLSTPFKEIPVVPGQFVSPSPVATLETSERGTTEIASDFHPPPAPTSRPVAQFDSGGVQPEMSPPPEAEKLLFKKDSKTPPPPPLESIKKFSETIKPFKATVPAELPFSILIEGELRPEEKEKLLTLLEDHEMGFRAIDLEPQLACNRVLIPRISEYAAILLVQALRATRAEIKFGPSDEIFASKNTRDAEEADLNGPGSGAYAGANFASSQDENVTSAFASDLSHPAESIPVTPQDTLPGSPLLILIDTVTANATLKSTVVEAEHSSDFQEIVEALQREIKYKSYRKGATAVINFKVQLHSLSQPTHYRILAVGTAVKLHEQSFDQPKSEGPELPA